MAVIKKSKRVRKYLLLLVAGVVGVSLWVSFITVFDKGGQSPQPTAGLPQPVAKMAPTAAVKPIVREVHHIAKNKLDTFRSALLLLLYPGSSMIAPVPDATIPTTLLEEDTVVRQYYQTLLKEKQRWDRHRQDKYRAVLETFEEPARIDQPELMLHNETNRVLLSDLVQTLNLHKQLLRDVRMFHDEVRFREKQTPNGHGDRLYEHKYKLAPFAREAALADALQQALSTLSSGLYQEEALEVIERLSAEYTQPVQRLQGQLAETDRLPAAITYNYNIFIVYGKRLMRFSDMLLQQTRVGMAPPAFGELDFFYRRLSQSFDDLEQISQNETLPPTHLDPNNLTPEPRTW